MTISGHPSVNGRKGRMPDRLNQVAYSYYGSTAINRSGAPSSASGVKRLFAAALLSSTSLIVMGSPSAQAMSSCSPTPANGVTSTCSGTITNSEQFTADNVTIITDAAFNQDTSGNDAAMGEDNVGIKVTGNNVTINHNGAIRTGDTPTEMDPVVVNHPGIYVNSTGGAGVIRSYSGASTHTEVANSDALRISNTGGSAVITNQGTADTTGNYSYGLAAVGSTTATAGNQAGGMVVTRGYKSYGVFAAGTTATAYNEGTGATVTTSGQQGHAVFASANEGGTAIAINRTGGVITTSGNNTGGVYAKSDTTATATNNGTITQTGTFSGAVAAAAGAGTANAYNTGTITITNPRGRGIFAVGGTVNLANSGTIGVAGDYGAGIYGSSYAITTTNITNSSSITVSGDYSAGIVGLGPTVNVTNDMGATISATGYYSHGIRAAGSTVSVTNNGSLTASGAHAVGIYATSSAVMTTTVINTGTINTADSAYHGIIGIGPTVNITNSGTVNGIILGSGSTPTSSVTIVNEGGTVGDGTTSISVGRTTYSSTVTIRGTGNDINGILFGGGYTSTLNFNQTDTLTLDTGGARKLSGEAVYGFTTANFNNGTTVFANGLGLSTYGCYCAPAMVNVNAGATLTTSSTNFYTRTDQLNVSGFGTSRGTLQVPAGSTIQVTGDTTFNAGGRFRVGVASDTDAGQLTARDDGNITFNAGSEIYADVTRGIELTDGGAIKIASVDSGEGGMIVDNNMGGVPVYDNTVLFSFTSEVRTNSELFLITNRELRARTATENQGGRTNAEVIADAIDEFIDNAPSDNVIVTYLAQFPVDQQEAVLAQLVEDSLPSESGSTGSSTVVSTDMVLDLIMDRLSGGGFTVVDSGERQTGVAAGEQLLGGVGNWALWGRAGASFAEYEPSGVNGFDSDTYAVSLGLDGDINEHLRMGLAVFYSDTKVDETGTGANSNQDIEGYGLLLYGTYRPEDFYVNATLGLGMNEYDSRRSAAGGLNTANYDGRQFMARAEVGKVFTQDAWDLSPHVGLRFNYVEIDGYTETGILPTTVASQSLTSLRGVLGLSGRYTHTLEDGAKLIPEAYIRGLQELADPNEAITGTVVGGGTFVSQTQKRDKFSYAVGGGLTYEMDDQFSVRFLYDGEFQTDYQEHSITGAVRYQF